MQYKELIKLVPQELTKRLQEGERALLDLRFAHAITPLEDLTSLKKARKLIARIKTAQRTQKNTQQP